MRADDSFTYSLEEIARINASVESALSSKEFGNQLSDKVFHRFEERLELSDKKQTIADIVPDKNGNWHDDFVARISQKLGSQIHGLEHLGI